MLWVELWTARKKFMLILKQSKASLGSFTFLSPEECLTYRNKIFELKSYWENCSNDGIPFYTLGVASYLHMSNKSAYYEKIKKINPILNNHFASLYDFLCLKMSEILNTDCLIAEEQGYPGFHLGFASDQATPPRFPPHFDLQFELLEWPFSHVDTHNPISFTAAIAMPKQGTGLNYWDIGRACSHDERVQLLKSTPKQYFPYKLGELVVHQGSMLHQISGHIENKEDERITLQGHGLLCDGKVRLYW